MSQERHLTTAELEAGLDDIRQSPPTDGALMAIVRRPRENEREALTQAMLTESAGLVGDSWSIRRSRSSADGSPDPNTQINIMNSRAVALVAQSPDRWPLAGDQLYVGLDLSGDNLLPGTRLAIGSAILEVTPVPHTGCHKFVARFGRDAKAFVNSPVGRKLNLRGINARVIQAGTVQVGDPVRKLAASG